MLSVPHHVHVCPLKPGMHHGLLLPNLQMTTCSSWQRWMTVSIQFCFPRSNCTVRRVSSRYWRMVIQKWPLIRHAPGAQDDVDVKAKKVEQVLGTEIKPAAEGAVPVPLLKISGHFLSFISERLVPNLTTPHPTSNQRTSGSRHHCSSPH